LRDITINYPETPALNRDRFISIRRQALQNLKKATTPAFILSSDALSDKASGAGCRPSYRHDIN